MLTRRKVLQGVGSFIAGGVGLGGYAFGIEPMRLALTRYRLTPPGWPPGLRLKLAIVADLHASEPWMPLSRVHGIVERVNDLGADAILLLGDYTTGHRLVHRDIPDDDWARALAGLRAPLGIHAVLGNHDWWNDGVVQRQMSGAPKCRAAMERAGLKVYENDVLRLEKDGLPFWLAGLGDQWAFYGDRRRRNRNDDRFGYTGVDDLSGTLAKVTDDAPVLLMAHEPDVFPRVPARVALTLSGHTHGGQVQFFGFAPIVPSKYGRRYVYGHVVEDDRHLIVSGGLGCSGLPVRFGRPPEIVEVEVMA